jgi:hypothetical protein
MFDTFPYASWLNEDGSPNTDIAGFWTWGPGNSNGTYILTVLGVAVMIIAFVGFVMLENRKLARQQATLQASGALNRPSTGV